LQSFIGQSLPVKNYKEFLHEQSHTEHEKTDFLKLRVLCGFNIYASQGETAKSVRFQVYMEKTLILFIQPQPLL
jgi:hypothetical protein